MDRERRFRIRQLREERNLSQTRLASIAGLNPTTVNQIEQGTRQPSTRTLSKLAEALGVSVPELFEDAASPLAEAPSGSTSPEATLAAGQRRTIPDALQAYAQRRTSRFDQELQDQNSPHFSDATKATLWVEMVQNEARDWAEWAMEEASVLMPQTGGLSDSNAWRDAFKVLGSLLTVREITRRADQRIAAMFDKPDELAQRRLEKARREAQESERQLMELQATGG